MTSNACKVSEKKTLQKAMQGFQKDPSCILITDLTIQIPKHYLLAVFSLVVIIIVLHLQDRWF